MSQITLELAHQRLKLEGQAAEAKGERRKLQESWEERLANTETEHKTKMDELVAKLARDRNQSDVTRLRTRLAAREAKIQQLEEEVTLCQIDGQTLSIAQSRETELRVQLETVTHELLEAKQHHTPVINTCHAPSNLSLL